MTKKQELIRLLETKQEADKRAGFGSQDSGSWTKINLRDPQIKVIEKEVIIL